MHSVVAVVLLACSILGTSLGADVIEVEIGLAKYNVSFVAHPAGNFTYAQAAALCVTTKHHGVSGTLPTPTNAYYQRVMLDSAQLHGLLMPFWLGASCDSALWRWQTNQLLVFAFGGRCLSYCHFDSDSVLSLDGACGAESGVQCCSNASFWAASNKSSYARSVLCMHTWAPSLSVSVSSSVAPVATASRTLPFFHIEPNVISGNALRYSSSLSERQLHLWLVGFPIDWDALQRDPDAILDCISVSSDFSTSPSSFAARLEWIVPTEGVLVNQTSGFVSLALQRDEHLWVPQGEHVNVTLRLERGCPVAMSYIQRETTELIILPTTRLHSSGLWQGVATATSVLLIAGSVLGYAASSFAFVPPRTAMLLSIADECAFYYDDTLPIEDHPLRFAFDISTSTKHLLSSLIASVLVSAAVLVLHFLLAVLVKVRAPRLTMWDSVAQVRFPSLSAPVLLFLLHSAAASIFVCCAAYGEWIVLVALVWWAPLILGLLLTVTMLFRAEYTDLPPSVEDCSSRRCSWRWIVDRVFVCDHSGRWANISNGSYFCDCFGHLFFDFRGQHPWLLCEEAAVTLLLACCEGMYTYVSCRTLCVWVAVIFAVHLATVCVFRPHRSRTVCVAVASNALVGVVVSALSAGSAPAGIAVVMLLLGGAAHLVAGALIASSPIVHRVLHDTWRSEFLRSSHELHRATAGGRGSSYLWPPPTDACDAGILEMHTRWIPSLPNDLPTEHSAPMRYSHVDDDL